MAITHTFDVESLALVAFDRFQPIVNEHRAAIDVGDINSRADKQGNRYLQCDVSVTSTAAMAALDDLLVTVHSVKKVGPLTCVVGAVDDKCTLELHIYAPADVEVASVVRGGAF